MTGWIARSFRQTVSAGLVMGAGVFGVLAQDLPALEAQRTEQQGTYSKITEELTLSKERVEEITAEIADIRKDHASLSAALVQAAKTERKLAEEVGAIANRLDVLGLQEKDLRDSLKERRGVLAEVLGALQRMGLNPPPAILVRPEDALSSVRSSILLAAVVPDLRGETEILIGDLQELSRLMATIDSQRERLSQTVSAQMAEQERLSILVEEKQQLQAETETRLLQEQAHAFELSQQASSLRELIDALESDIEIAARQAENPEAQTETPRQPGAQQFRLPGTLPLPALLGKLELPVSGHVQMRFGQSDTHGGTMQGDMVATHSTAIVTAPVDASVLYAGPFRSYGQLLILNAGDGYHVVLAGMARISVSPGQSVLAGEPVGLMGEARVASAVAVAQENTGPELYVEFRKDGKPVDPAPWWVERKSGRTGNDT
jgi:septal ring factor EnvC (AmiA/AmiB activator)